MFFPFWLYLYFLFNLTKFYCSFIPEFQGRSCPINVIHKYSSTYAIGTYIYIKFSNFYYKVKTNLRREHFVFWPGFNVKMRTPNKMYLPEKRSQTKKSFFTSQAWAQSLWMNESTWKKQILPFCRLILFNLFNNKILQRHKHKKLIKRIIFIYYVHETNSFFRH